METQVIRRCARRASRGAALCLCVATVAISAACSNDSSGTRSAATASPVRDTTATVPADAPGGRDFRRIRRYPGSWISEAHDTYYIYCADILINYRDFEIDYSTMDTDGDRIVEYFKSELQRSGGYRVTRDDKVASGITTTWRVDFRLPNAALMCRPSPSGTLERDVYMGDVQLTVARGTSAPTSVQLDVLLGLQSDSPY